MHLTLREDKCLIHAEQSAGCSSSPMSSSCLFLLYRADMSCREQHVKVARTAVVGRDSAVGTGSSLDEGTQVNVTALHAWIGMSAAVVAACHLYSTEFHS
jgi:hypothetical protein